MCNTQTALVGPSAYVQLHVPPGNLPTGLVDQTTLAIRADLGALCTTGKLCIGPLAQQIAAAVPQALNLLLFMCPGPVGLLAAQHSYAGGASWGLGCPDAPNPSHCVPDSAQHRATALQVLGPRMR